ncbi:MAG: sulfite exporter TauE/SafE family protein [Candidatus Hodarchaeota archaeon]
MLLPWYMGLAVSLMSIGIGCISTMIGIGGGSLLIPVLVMIFGVDIHTAVAVSMFMIVFSKISGTIAYGRKNVVDYRVGLTFGLTTAIGAFLGALFSAQIESLELQAIFGAVLAATSLIMIIRANSGEKEAGECEPKRFSWKREIVDTDGKSHQYIVQIIPSLVAGFFAGLIGGLLGLGGGTILVPVMVFICGMPMHIAVATSTFTIVIVGASGTIGHIIFGSLDIVLGVIVIVGSIIGSYLAPRIALSISPKKLKIIFGVFLLLVAIGMMWPWVGQFLPT